MTALTGEAVDDILMDVLFTDEELPENPTPDNLPENAVVVEGIINMYAFNGDRLESHREEVKALLLELPEAFRESGGGGWSFLQACDDRHGNQWTGFHITMGALFSLGIGLGLAKYILPREQWSVLPGGMPYIVVLDKSWDS